MRLFLQYNVHVCAAQNFIKVPSINKGMELIYLHSMFKDEPVISSV